jgi:hypothetical protein
MGMEKPWTHPPKNLLDAIARAAGEPCVQIWDASDAATHYSSEPREAGETCLISFRRDYRGYWAYAVSPITSNIYEWSYQKNFVVDGWHLMENPLNDVRATAEKLCTAYLLLS